jgi:hypothetical protein
MLNTFTGAGREISGVFSKLKLGSVTQHHPDALPSIANLQFTQSWEN